MIVYVRRIAGKISAIYSRQQEDATERISDDDVEVIAFNNPPKTTAQIAIEASEARVKDLSRKSTLSAAELQEAVKSLLNLKVREIE